MRIAWGSGPRCKPAQNNHGLVFFLIRAASHEEGARGPFIQSGLLPQAPKEGPVVTPPSRSCPVGREVGHRSPPSACPSLSSLVQLYGRHMETVSIYPAPPGCGCTLCSSERKPWIPRRAVAEAACKAASCFAGSVWACYISVAICANRSSWCVGLRSGWGAALRRGGRVSVTVLYPHACPSGLVFRARLLPVILVHLPGPIARIRGE